MLVKIIGTSVVAGLITYGVIEQIEKRKANKEGN
jgi:hypothetical protein